MKTFLKFLCLFLCAFALKAANTIYTAPDETGLVGYWKMDEGGLTNVIDYSGNGNNGTNVNGATLTNGVIGGALSFNGSQYIMVPYSSVTDPPAITECAWVKFNNFTNNYTGIIGANPNNSNTTFQILLIKWNGKLAPFYYASSSINYDGTGTFTLVSNVWYFLAVTYSSTTGLKGYVNGSLDNSVSANGPLSLQSIGVVLGEDAGNTSRLLNGFIDEARIYNRALSATEITNLYNFRQTSLSTNGSTGYNP